MAGLPVARLSRATNGYPLRHLAGSLVRGSAPRTRQGLSPWLLSLEFGHSRETSALAGAGQNPVLPARLGAEAFRGAISPDRPYAQRRPNLGCDVDRTARKPRPSCLVCQPTASDLAVERVFGALPFSGAWDRAPLLAEAARHCRADQQRSRAPVCACSTGCDVEDMEAAKRCHGERAGACASLACVADG